MPLIRRLAVLLALCCLLPAARAEDLTAEKRADIQKLMQMTGALSLGRQMGVALSAQIAQRMARSRPDIPQKLIDALPEIVGSVFDANTPALLESIVPIYHHNFSGAEIKGLVQFYSTPLGQKTIKALPSVLQESMVAGRKWGDSITPQIEDRVRQRFKKDGVVI